MPEAIHFIGFISNVDSTILQLKLEHEFRIDAMTIGEATKCISNLEGGRRNAIDIQSDLYKKRCMNTAERRVYYIKNTFKFDEDSASDATQLRLEHGAKIDRDYITGYLSKVISILRLFKEGNVLMPLHYLDGGKTSQMVPTVYGPYTLEKAEIENLESLLHLIELPFGKPFLKNAFELFELSYAFHDPAISLILLITALETLLKGRDDKSHDVRRGVAILLTRINDKDNICSELKSLYGKRNDAVHDGLFGKVCQGDVLKIRHYVRDCIKEIYNRSLEKDQLIADLKSNERAILNTRTMENCYR
jgi:hypothetical protein